MKMKLVIVGLLAAAALMVGQKVKSQKELDAINAVVTAATPDQKIAAAETMVRDFKDSDFRGMILVEATQAAVQKGDGIMAIQYATRALQAEPKNYQAMLLLAGQLAQSTREFDLDKDEKLTRATQMANDAIAAVTAAVKPNPQLTDAQWADFRKDSIAQAHEALGMIAGVKKQWDTAIKEFQTSVDGAATPEPTSSVRLAVAYVDAKRFDEGIALLDKVAATPGVSDQVKKVILSEKQRAEKLKAAK